jgi:hypothetical protein
LVHDTALVLGFEAPWAAQADPAHLGGFHAAYRPLADHFPFEFGKRA